MNAKKTSVIKKTQYLIIISLILTTIANIGFAHSGRTDAYGGHYDRTTGVYHYHSGGYHTSQKSLLIADIVGILFTIITLIFIAIFVIHQLIQIINDKRESIKRFNFEKIMYTELYENKNINELVIIPNGTSIKEDGLPYGEDISEYFNYGKLYTRYYSNGSKVYHSNYGCSGVNKQINTYKIQVFKLRSCLRCASNDILPDTHFVNEYHKIISICNRYNIKIIIPQHDDKKMN